MSERVPFRIDGEDFSDCVKAGGFKWKKYDLEGEKAGRTLDGIMRRKRIARKRQLTIACKRLTDARLRQLCNAIDKETVMITYPDPMFGTITKTFYGTEVEAAIWAEMNGTLYWSDANFQVTEV